MCRCAVVHAASAVWLDWPMTCLTLDISEYSLTTIKLTNSLIQRQIMVAAIAL